MFSRTLEAEDRTGLDFDIEVYIDGAALADRELDADRAASMEREVDLDGAALALDIDVDEVPPAEKKVGVDGAALAKSGVDGGESGRRGCEQSSAGIDGAALCTTLPKPCRQILMLHVESEGLVLLTRPLPLHSTGCIASPLSSTEGLGIVAWLSAKSGMSIIAKSHDRQPHGIC